MLEHSQILASIKHFFESRGYGNTLREYIVNNNPKTHADIEILERQWLYRNFQHTGGQWL